MNKLAHQNICAALLGSVALVALTASAFAQQQGVEEIVVTAERHAQSILMVPSAIQAETSQQLTDQGIKDFTDLQFVTPGFLPSDSSGYTQLFIRGVGNSIFVGADPSVAMYIDDVPRIYGSLANQFVDVDRVEVLKGAQGGLYGRNATGGVVNVITLQPSTDAIDGTVSISYGTSNSLDVAGYVNVPITDDLAANFSIEHVSSDPLIKNIAKKDPYSAADFAGNSAAWGTPAQQAATLNGWEGTPESGYDGKNQTGLNTKLMWQPTSNFKITLGGDYFTQDDSSGLQLVDVTPAVTQTDLVGVLGAFGFTPNLPPGFEQTSGKFETANGGVNFVQLRDWGGSITAVYNAPFADFTDITAYRGQHTYYQSDLTASSEALIDANVDNKKHFFYQELRAQSNGEGAIHWLAGGTFLNDLFTGNTHVGELNPGIGDGFAVAHAYQLIQDWTLYAQVGYDITKELNFTASYRYLQETNTANFVFPFAYTAAAAEHANIPSATLSYALDDGSVYIRWAHGFKAGGVNVVANPAFFIPPDGPTGGSLSDGSVFGPEKVDTYEAGYKQALLDRRLQLSADIFYNKYNGLQESAHTVPAEEADVILAIINAGSARTYGAEGSINYQVIDPLTLGANVGYLNALYENFSVAPNPILAPFVNPATGAKNLDGTQMINAPTWQLSFTANLDQPISDDFRLVGSLVEANVSHQIYIQSGIPCLAGNPNQDKLNVNCLGNADGPGYWITNIRLGVKTRDDKYEVSVFANNLFDQAYFTYGSSSSEGNSANWGNPRIVGVQLTASY